MTTLMTEAAPSPEGDASKVTADPAASADASKATDQAATDQAAAKTAADAEAAKAGEQSFELKAPEGKTFPDGFEDAVKAQAKDLGLNPEQAQKLSESELARSEKAQADQTEQLATLHNGWKEAAKADKEFGGEKFNENLAIAQKGMKHFASPELLQMMDATGFGDHPEVIRMFHKIGKQVSEDTFVPGDNAGAATDPAKRLFPNQN